MAGIDEDDVVTDGRDNAFRILLVEDNPADADLIREHLLTSSFAGAELDVADSLETAEVRLRARPPSVILLDLGLPSTEDLEALVYVRRVAPAVPILVLTGRQDERLVARAVAEGAEDYLYKNAVSALELTRSLTQAVERHRFHAEVALQRERLRAIVARTPDALVVTDRDGSIRFLNPAAEILLGRAFAELHGTALGYPVTADAPLRVDIQTPDGRRRAAELRAADIDWEGAPARLVALRDITDRLELQRQLLQAQKMKAIGALAGGIAHDFNNILAIIDNAASFVADGVEGTEQSREDLATIRQATARATDLVRQLLAFSRRQVQRLEVVDVNDAVAAMQQLLRRTLGADVDLQLLIHPDPLRVVADRTQLDQVLLNLAVNARAAMPGGGALTIATERVEVVDGPADRDTAAGPFAAISVRDTGSGMDEATQKRIFEPFFSTKAPGQGTGLGLSTVFGIVTQSKGDIRVTSAPGAGTTFTIRLPLTESEATTNVQQDDPAPGDLRGSETVLLVEDDLELLRIIRRLLAEAGYRVLEAEHGTAAIELARSHDAPVHLLVTDVVMPGLSGPELAARLRADRPDLGVVYISGYAHDALRDRGLSPGEQLVTKPFEAQALLSAVRQALAQASRGTRGRPAG